MTFFLKGYYTEQAQEQRVEASGITPTGAQALDTPLVSRGWKTCLLLDLSGRATRQPLAGIINVVAPSDPGMLLWGL